jgi:hypothetical protein
MFLSVRSQRSDWDHKKIKRFFQVNLVPLACPWRSLPVVRTVTQGRITFGLRIFICDAKGGRIRQKT